MTEDSLHIRPKSLRVLAPAGGFPSPLATFNAWRSLRQLACEKGTPNGTRELFREVLNRRFHVKHVEFYGSGSEALYRVFSSIQSSDTRTVGMAAYTCPSVASAAVRAGFQILPIDIDENTLAMDPLGVDPKKLCAVICSNLYGLVDDINCWRDSRGSKNLVLIDDACQAGLSADKSARVGTREGSIGVFSFGRGKAFSGIGGGAVLSNEQLPLPSREDWAGAKPEIFTCLKHVGVAGVISALEKPLVFGLPARMSFLRLGETHCDIDFPIEPLSDVQLSVAYAQVEREAETKQIVSERVSQWQEILHDCDLVQPVIERRQEGSVTIVPIRYPVLFRNKQQRDRVWKKLAEAGLGASISYPKPLQEYSELGSYIERCETPRARKVAETILTLPVHRYVQRNHIEQAATIIKQGCNS